MMGNIDNIDNMEVQLSSHEREVKQLLEKGYTYTEALQIYIDNESRRSDPNHHGVREATRELTNLHRPDDIVRLVNID